MLQFFNHNRTNLDPIEVFTYLAKNLVANKFTCFPNPAVGCLIHTSDNKIAIGYHKFAGKEHAEIDAINQLVSTYGEDTAKTMLAGSTFYVTLEPCAHHGRTPPCVESLIKYKIKKCIIGDFDPTSKVNGKGIQALKDAGIAVEVLNVNQLDLINQDFKYLDKIEQNQNLLPYTRIKVAATIDNYVALNNGNSKWISNSKSRALVHLLRARADAVLTSSTTIIKDSASYNVRQENISADILSKMDSSLLSDPYCVIIDNSLNLTCDLKVFTTAAKKIIVSKNLHPLVTTLSPKFNIAILTVHASAQQDLSDSNRYSYSFESHHNKVDSRIIREPDDKSNLSSSISLVEKNSNLLKISSLVTNNGSDIFFINGDLDTHSPEGMKHLFSILRKAFNVNDLLVETGGRLTSSILKYGLYDEIHYVVAPIIMGKGIKAFEFDSNFIEVAQAPKFQKYTFEIDDDVHVIYLKDRVN